MRKFLKKAMVMGTSLFTLCAGVGFTTSSLSAQEKVLNLAISSEPPTIDPAIATDSTSGAIVKNVFDGLTGVEGGEAVPAAAESWEMSEDGLTYTFKLRADATWSNGDPVKASDFEFAWKRVLNPETASEYANLLYIIEGAEAYNTGEGEADAVGIKALDDTTFEVKLINPTAYFPELVAHYTFMPVNQAVVEANENWASEAGEDYVTNGAFTLSEWNHSSDYVLAKNDGYWDVDNVALDRVNVQIIESEATANAQFQSGALDYIGAPYSVVSLDAIDTYKAEGSLNVSDYAAIYWYKVNTTDEVMSNANIRKALALAIDRQSLVDNITKGEQSPALGLVPPTIQGFEEDRGYFQDADFEQAKEYLTKGLEELGKSDPSEIKINLSINTSEAHSTIAQFIQAGWTENLGIQVEIDNSEWQVYLDKLSMLDYQVGRMGWIADYNDASTFLSMYDTANNGNNDTGWESEAYKSLLDQATAETDEAKRTDLFKQAEAIIIDEMPVIPIYFYTNLSVKKDTVKNMEPDALGNIILKNVDVE